MEFDATFLVAIVSFIVFVVIMNKIFYYPVWRIINEREAYVANFYEDAKKAKSLMERDVEIREKGLQESRSEAQAIIAEKSQALKREKTQTISRYKEELFDNISKEKESLKKSVVEAKDILKDNVVDIAKGISYKILGDSVDASLINKAQIQDED